MLKISAINFMNKIPTEIMYYELFLKYIKQIINDKEYFAN